MTRYLGLSLRGEYALVMNYANLAATILNLGISLVLPGFLKNRTDFCVNDFISLSFYQAFFYIILILIFFYFDSNIRILLISLISCLMIFKLQITNIGNVVNVKNQAISTIVGGILNIIGIILVYSSTSSNKLLWIILIFVSKDITIIGTNLFYLNFQLLYPKRKWVLILRAGLLPMIVTGLIAINYRIDVLMLEYLNVDFLMIGLFATGVSLAEYSWLIPDIFKEVMINKNTRKDDIVNLNISIRFGFTAVLIFAFLFIIFGNFILNALFGSKFEASYKVTLLMFFAVPFMVFVKLIGTLFITNQKWLLYFKVLLITVIINIFGNYVLIKTYGMEGAAYASILSYAFCGLYCLFWYARNYKIPIKKLFIINFTDIVFLRNYFLKSR